MVSAECVPSRESWMPQIRSDSTLDTRVAGVVFFHRIAQPPQPHLSVDVGERRLSQTAVCV